MNNKLGDFANVLRSLVRRVIPEVVRAYVRARRYSVKELDLTKIQILKNWSIAQLRDASILEMEILPQLGLNNEIMEEFPTELYSRCGSGLFIWQYPSQFSKYLALLSKYPISSYLEIGVRHGGTFVTTIEYLKRFNGIKNAIGVDVVDNASLREYSLHEPAARFIQVDSTSPEFNALLLAGSRFSLTLVDGDHSEQACRSDVNNVMPYSDIVALHDIASDVCPGVRKVWNELRRGNGNTHEFFEFTEQYASVRKKTGRSYLGIGVAIRREFAASREGNI